MNKEVLGLGESGLEALTTDDWTEALLTPAADPDRRRAMGRVGRAVVERHFDVPVVAAHIATVFRDVVEGVLISGRFRAGVPAIPGKIVQSGPRRVFLSTHMTKALITGGAGFIGSNLARLLLDHGHGVTVLDNLSSGYRRTSLPSRWRSSSRATCATATPSTAPCRRRTSCFHLAASVGNTRSIEHPLLDSEINVIGTLTVLEAARHRGVRKLVFSSSAGIFGELKTLPIAEDHPVEPDTPYGASKLGRREAVPRLRQAVPDRMRVPALFQRLRRQPALRRLRQRHPDLRAPHAARTAGDHLTATASRRATSSTCATSPEANYGAAMSRGVSGAFNIASGTRVTINALVGIDGRGQRPQPRGSSTVRRARATCGTASPTSARRARASASNPASSSARGSDRVHAMGTDGRGLAHDGPRARPLAGLSSRCRVDSADHGRSVQDLRTLGHTVSVVTTTPHYNRDAEARPASRCAPGGGGVQRSDFHGTPVFHTLTCRPERVGAAAPGGVDAVPRAQPARRHLLPCGGST